MRRKYFGLAIAAFATLGPMQAWGGDREIAEQIIQRLKSNRDSGELKDFTLDMKVDQGVVHFRGSVSQEAQRDLVLKATDGIDGISNVVDELKVASAATTVTPEAEVAATEAPVDAAAPANSSAPFSFREALAAQAQEIAAQVAQTKPQPVAQVAPEPTVQPVVPAAQVTPVEAVAQAAPVAPLAVEAPLNLATTQIMPGEIMRTAAEAPTSDQQIVSAVVQALNQAKNSGELKGFGVDVKSQNGVLHLQGRASSAEQRDMIIAIAESIPGISGVQEQIAVQSQTLPELPRLPEPRPLEDFQEPTLSPVLAAPPTAATVPAQVASAPMAAPSYQPQQVYQAASHPMHVAAHPMQAVAGQPVPMAPYGAAGAGPRYDTPNLPNYAWPGYAAYPNYAALTYPQQYSPSAFPYIGPFYPYPQVPLGWRKVSLEWDDGWWYLDFTDR